MYTKRMGRVLTACVLGLALVVAGMCGRASADSVKVEGLEPVRRLPKASTLSAQAQDIDIMWYDANYGEGAQYYKSDEPISVSEAVYGEVSQEHHGDSIRLSASCTDERYAAGSGIAFSTGLTVGELQKIAILGDFGTGGTGVFNLFFDLDKDGAYFEFDQSGAMTGLGDDNYALCGAHPAEGQFGFIIDGSTPFHIMKGGGVHTLAEIAEGEAGIPADTPVAFWVGVWDATADNKPLTLDLWDVRANPDFVQVDGELKTHDPALATGDILTTDDGSRYVFGYDAFGSIQEAIDGVCSGGVVWVYPGLYDEEITIDKSLRLWGDWTENDWPVISPSTPVNTVVTVKGNDVDAVIDGFVIQGPFEVDSSENFLAGMLVRDGAYCQISGNRILDVRESEELSGMQRGIAVWVGRKAWNTSGTARIEGNLIQGYQKGGIVVDNTGSHAVITDNTIIGWGKTPVTAQNGIQVSRGATATVTGNTVKSHWYTGENWSACGILFWEGAGETSVTGNTLNANQVAIYIDDRSSLPGVFDNTFGTGEEANGCDVAADTGKWLAPSEVWVDTAYGDPGLEDDEVIGERIKGYDAFATIQEAISAVAPDGVVNVGAGTFTEHGRLSISKDLSIVGQGPGQTTIKTDTSFTGDNHTDESAWILVSEGVTFNLSGVTLDGSGQAINAGILAHGKVEIENCEFTNIAGQMYLGMAINLHGADGSRISDCTFSNIGRIGVYTGNGSDSVTIEGNTYTGKGAVDGLDYAFEVGRDGQAVIRNNMISGNRAKASTDESTSAGILVTTFYGPAQATIERNTITDCTTAVAVGYNDQDESRVTVHYNAMYDNDCGVASKKAAVDATLNYWGEAGPQGLVEGPVDCDPWWVDKQMTTLGTASMVLNLTRSTSHDDLEEAVELAGNGDVLQVADGEITVAGTLSITKPLTLLGPNAGVNPNTGTRKGEAVIKGTIELNTPSGAEVTIDGFKFLDDQLGRNFVALYLRGSGDYKVRNCVFERNTGKTDDELASEKDRMIRAIHIGPASCSALIENNRFTGSGVNVYRNSSWRSAIWSDGVTGGTVDIQGNVFDTNRTALNLDNKVDNITITDNTFLRNGTHISFGGSPVLSGQYSISRNEFSLAGAVFNLSGVDPGFRLDATGNKYDVAFDSTENAKAPKEMTLDELFVLESAMYHKGKGGKQGLVRIVEDTVFVTTESGTIQQAIDAASPGDTVLVKAGTYNEAFRVDKGVTIKGAGIGETVIQPLALLETGIGHKYDANMRAALLVDGAEDVHIQDMTIDGNNLGANAVVFWNSSKGSLDRVKVMNPKPFDGTQTGQGIAVDAGSGQTTLLDVNDCEILDFNKNGIDAVNGNGGTSGGGSITVNVKGGAITGRGLDNSTNCQNGILFWERAGGSVGGSVDGVTMQNIWYQVTDPEKENESCGVLLYGVKNGTVTASNVSFKDVEQYIGLAAQSTGNLVVDKCTFDDVAPTSASAAQLAAIEDKILHVMDDPDVGTVYIVPDTIVVTQNNRGIQAAVDAALPGDTVRVAAGTYRENVVIPGGKNNLSLVGAGSGATTIAPASGRPLALQGYPGGAYPNATSPIDGVKIQGFTLKTGKDVPSHAFIALSSTPDGKPYTTNLALTDIVVDGGQRGIGLNAVEGATLTNVRVKNIRGGEEGALELTGVSGLTFTGGSLEGNELAVRLQPTGGDDPGKGYGPNRNLEIHGADITGNLVAIDNRDADVTIDATGNYWGADSGPKHASNPGGKGNEVQGNVRYSPWLTADGEEAVIPLEVAAVYDKGKKQTVVTVPVGLTLHAVEVNEEEVDPLPTVTDGRFSVDPLDGLNNIRVEMRDALGNIYRGSCTLAIDMTAPATALKASRDPDGLDGWYKGPAAPTVTLSTEAGGRIRYRWNGGDWTESSGNEAVALPVPEGVNTLYYYAVDAEGNQEPEKSHTFKVDTVAPAGSIVINSGRSSTTSRAVTLTLSCTGEVSTEKFSMKLSNDAGMAGADWQSFAETVSWTLLDGYGEKAVYVQFRDQAGNESVIYSDSITLVRSGGGGGGAVTPPPVQPPVVAGSTTEDIEPEAGGTVALPDNSAAVTLPPAAVEEDVKVTVAPVTEVTKPTQGMVKIGNRVYEITVETKDGKRVTSFSEAITLTFQYADEELGGTSPEDLKIFYWDEAAGAWVAIPSTVDPVSKTVVGTTDHLTVFALMAKPGMPPMPDIKGHWAEAPVLRLVSLGVVGGYDDGTFRPEVTITREQFAKMIVLASGIQPEAAPALAFADNDSISGWARGYVAAAVKAGIIKGLEGNRFGPAQPVTRAQVATMLVRALNLEAGATSTTFADNAEIPSWAVSSVQAAVEKGIVGGFADGTFKPGLSATRAQAAKMLSQFMTVRLSQ